MKTFYQGQKLQYVSGPQGPVGECISYSVGLFNCTGIEVVMENSQIGVVPWALIFEGDKLKAKVNLALMEEVGLIANEGENDA